MKKVLFASTALVAFTGAAAAEISLSGSAEMGLSGKTGTSIQFHQEVDITFTASGESDNGLSFGMAVDLDEGDNLGGTYVNNGVAVFISGAFGTVTLGDTDGAMDWALSEVAVGGGAIADDHTGHAGYGGNNNYLDGNGDGQILRYDNTFGDFGVAISVESDRVGADSTDLDEDTAGDQTASGDYGFALGLKYNLDLGGTTVALGLGYQKALGDASVVGISAKATLDSGLILAMAYSDWSDHANDKALSLGVGYETGAISVGANYGKVDLANGGDVDGFGISGTYDLGGGLVFKAGYGKDDGTESGSIGFGMSF